MKINRQVITAIKVSTAFLFLSVLYTNFTYGEDVKLSPTNYVRDIEVNFWTEGQIVFDLDPAITAKDRSLIMGACQDWTSGTALQCILGNDTKNYDKSNSYEGKVRISYFSIPQNPAATCALPGFEPYKAVIGAPRYRDEATSAQLHYGCMNDVVAKRLMGQILGFIPEHQRLIRNNYLQVLHQNADPGNYRQDWMQLSPFIMLKPIFNDEKFKGTDAYNFKSYDFGSIMHLPTDYLSKTGNTLVPQTAYKSEQNVMGRSGRLSSQDRQMMKYIYGEIIERRADADCFFNGYQLKPNEMLTLKEKNVVKSGQECKEFKMLCQSKSGGRVVNNEYKYHSCYISAPAGKNNTNNNASRSCTFDGKTFPNFSYEIFYQTRTVPFGQECVSGPKNCRNGEVVNGEAFPYASCKVEAPKGCYLDGKNVAHLGIITAYKTKSGGNCVSNSSPRSCYNGSLTGDASFQYSSCGGSGGSGVTTTTMMPVRTTTTMRSPGMTTTTMPVRTTTTLKRSTGGGLVKNPKAATVVPKPAASVRLAVTTTTLRSPVTTTTVKRAGGLVLTPKKK